MLLMAFAIHGDTELLFTPKFIYHSIIITSLLLKGIFTFFLKKTLKMSKNIYFTMVSSHTLEFCIEKMTFLMKNM